MKKRAGFKPITVNNQEYKYSLSFGEYVSGQGRAAKFTKQNSLIIYNSDDKKHEFWLNNIEFPPDFIHSNWRGKHRDRIWGKKEVEFVIKNYLKN